MPRESKPWFRASSGTWVSRVNGKLRTLARGKGARKEAEAKLRIILADPKAEQTASVALGDLAAQFLAWSDANRAPMTATYYRRHVGALVRDMGARTPLGSITASACLAWANRPAWGQSTRRGALVSAQRMFSWAVGVGLAASDPLAKIEKPPVLRKARIPTTAEVAELVDGARGEARDLFAFLAETGCRQTEAYRLRVEHVDLAAGVCVMPGKTTHKTRRPRVIYLSAAASLLVSSRMNGRGREDLLFRSRDGAPWTMDSARAQVVRLRRRLGLPSHVTAGGLRHWWITERLRAGVPIAHVAELAGHTSTAMISRHYGHLSDHGRDLRRALERKAS